MLSIKYFGEHIITNNNYEFSPKVERILELVHELIDTLVIFYIEDDVQLTSIEIVNPCPIIMKCVVQNKTENVIPNQVLEAGTTIKILYPLVVRKKDSTRYMYEQQLLDHIQTNYVGGKLVGGLGNQMFIFAAAYAVAKQNNCALVLPMKNFCPSADRTVNEYWDSYFDFYESIISSPKYTKQIKVGDPFGFVTKQQRQLTGSILDGYFQHIENFSDYTKEVDQLFSGSRQIQEYITTKYEHLFNDNSYNVAVHVRRGDYLKLAHYHHNVPLKYYVKCFAEINKTAKANIRYIVFSDDINWCKKQFGNRAIYITNEKDYVEILMISKCDAVIMPNSTFSWWGAFLGSKKKQVYLPYKWLETGQYPHGLVLPGWKIISY